MQTITFYSYKGGVGRTLVVANVAFYLAQFGQKVVALDLDLEAPGLHYKLLPVSPDQDTTPLRGVVDYLHHFIEHGELPERIEDYLVQVPLRPSIAGSVHLMPAGAVPSPDYWHKLARLNWHDLFYSEDAPGIPLFLELKERIRAAYEPDFLLVDARTGITEIGGVATTVLPDQLVCLLLNNRENLEGARAVLRGIRNVPRPPGASAQVQVIPVLSRLPARQPRPWARNKPDEEDEILSDVAAFLNAPAERLEDTLEIPEPLVLHVDRALEVRERLLLETPGDRGESLLLGDYLHLFGKLIPPDVLLKSPQLDVLVAHAQGALLEDPDGAQRELENLAHIADRPEVYRELLRLYHARGFTGQQVLAVAERFWSLAQDANDPLLWFAIKKNLNLGARFFEGKSPSPNFLETVWRANGAKDVEIGKDLASIYATNEHLDHAADILLELSEHAHLDDKTIGWAIELLAWGERWESAQGLIDRNVANFGQSGRFLEAWARLVLSKRNDPVPPALGNALTKIAEQDPIIALNLAKRVAQQTGSGPAGNDLERQLLAVALSDDAAGKRMSDIRSWFDQAGRVDEFDSHLRSLFGKDADGLRTILTAQFTKRQD